MRVPFGISLECLWNILLCVISVSRVSCFDFHLVCGVSCFDFIYTDLEANQMPKKSAFEYDMKHTKMNEWSREDSSPHTDLTRHISLVPTYID